MGNTKEWGCEITQEGDVKINFDGASKENLSNAIVVRDDRHQCIVAFCQRYEEIIKNQVEVLSGLEPLHLICQYNLKEISLDGDFQIVVSMLKDNLSQLTGASSISERSLRT